MDYESITILVMLATATLAMLYYGRWHLPEQIEKRTRESMKAFSTAVELRFPVREGLSTRVVALGLECGRRLDLAPMHLKRLEMAARLRDIGLCAIPYRLVNDKPAVEWTDGESATYERHPEVGASMLELVPYLRHVAGIVRNHQANFDGSSGPFFASRKNLPKEARILRVVSDYVWFERTQGKLLAAETLREGSGSLYDPEVVRVFLGMLRSSRVAEPLEKVLV